MSGYYEEAESIIGFQEQRFGARFECFAAGGCGFLRCERRTVFSLRINDPL